MVGCDIVLLIGEGVMQLECVNEEPERNLIRGTRLGDILAPFHVYALHDFLTLSAELPEEYWLDRQPIINLFSMFRLMAEDLDHDPWVTDGVPELPNLSELQIDALWAEVRDDYSGHYRICRTHPWTYLRNAWHEVSGQWLPGRRNMAPIRLAMEPPHAYYFKLGVAYCLKRLHAFDY